MPHLESVVFLFFDSKHVGPSANAIRGEDLGGTYHVAYRIREAHRSEACAAIRVQPRRWGAPRGEIILVKALIFWVFIINVVYRCRGGVTVYSAFVQRYEQSPLIQVSATIVALFRPPKL